MLKVSLKNKRPIIKRRNFIAKELRENPLYRCKVITSKKVYNRKKIKIDMD